MVVLALTAMTATAHATALQWSPVNLAPGQQILNVTCESATLCTAFSQDPTSMQVTARSFDLTSPTHQIDVPLGAKLDNTIANNPDCVSASLCTAVVYGSPYAGETVSFDPSDASVPVQPVFPGEGGIGASAIGCADASECVVSDESSGAVEVAVVDPTTDTITAGPVGYASEDTPSTVACPTETQCTIGFISGDVTTFNPQTIASTGIPAPQKLPANDPDVVCPTAAECFAFDGSASVLSFDPLDLSSAYSNPLPAQARDVICLTATFCIGADGGTDVVSGNPQSSVPWATTPVTDGGPSVAGVACVDPTLCVAAEGDADVYIGIPPPPVGKTTIEALTPTATGVNVRLKCTGAKTATCALSFSLAAGISSGAAASRHVTFRPGTDTVRLVMVSRAQKLLRRYGELNGILTISQTVKAASVVIAKRSVTIHAVKR
jgi:hypothetical protein